MRTFFKAIGSLVLLVALLIGIVEGGALLARMVGHQLFHGVDPTVAAAVVAAGSTVIISVATLVFGRYFERRKAIETEIRAKKFPIYSKMVNGFIGLLLRANEPEQETNAESFFRELTPDLMTWASDDVLIAWSHFKRGINATSPERALFEFEKVLMEIRKDFGHSGRKVVEGDLLGLFVTDIDQHLAGGASSAPDRIAPPAESQEQQAPQSQGS